MHQARTPRGRFRGAPVIAIVLMLLSFIPVAGYAHGAGVQGGSTAVLRMSDEGGNALPSLEPPMVEPDSIMVIGLLFGGLVGLDQNLHVVPDGADSWSISSNGRIYTFHIRSGLRLGDGTPVTADDFAWSLNRALTPQFATGPAGYYLDNIKGATAVTNKKAPSGWADGIKVLAGDRLQITLSHPSSVFLQQLAFPASYLVPRASIARWGATWTEKAVGTGPFRMKEWRQKQEIVLEPNPYYWRGHLALREVDVELLSAEQAFTMYNEGNLDVMGAIAFPGDHLLKAQTLPDYHPQHLLLTDYLLPNVKKPPFTNAKVRQAFSYALNRQALASNTLGDTVFPAGGILPPGLPGFNTMLHGQTYDPARARRLLAEAGYPRGQGMPPITMLIDGSNPAAVKESTALQAAWKAVLGVTVAIQRISTSSAYNDALAGRGFQLALATWAADYPDPQDALSLQLQTGESSNEGSYSNAAFDRLTRRADVMEPHDPARYRLYQQAEQIAVDDTAWIVLDWGRSAVMIRPSVHGLVTTSLGVMAPDWSRVTVK